MFWRGVAGLDSRRLELRHSANSRRRQASKPRRTEVKEGMPTPASVCRDRAGSNLVPVFHDDAGDMFTHDHHRDQRDVHGRAEQREVGVRTASRDNRSACKRTEDRSQPAERQARTVPVARTSVG